MSQNASFTIPDSQATPVNYTFTPISTQNGIALYRADRGHSNVAAGTNNFIGVRPTISGSVRQGENGDISTRRGRVKRKVTFKIVVPDAWSGFGADDTPFLDTLETVVTMSIPVDAQTRAIEDMKNMVTDLVSTVPLDGMILGEFPY